MDFVDFLKLHQNEFLTVANLSFVTKRNATLNMITYTVRTASHRRSQAF